MPYATYKGFSLKKSQQIGAQWSVKIQSQTLHGDITTIKRAIDWYLTTSKIPDIDSLKTPTTSSTAKTQKTIHNGFVIKNDTNKEDEWYSFVYGVLLKGTIEQVQKRIDRAQQLAHQHKQQLK
ncbi:DUF3319 domain-containing protein [Vibrio sp.]|nr:DUF3319 domain-containing protein [Vibrio sp.]